MSNMRVINTGNRYQIHDSSMRTFDILPTQTYNVCFSKQQGWFLQKYTDDISVTEKIYGVHINKVNKVLSAFSAFERNLGVILSGDKGIGKSLFSKILANQALLSGYPLLIVNTYIPGIADFIDSIDQECVVLFDEFDKTFASCSGGPDPQAEMLTLFDGISQGKKLFVVTCNSLYKLNDFLVNRPGRFHYHFRFEYPTETEITEYMEDKLEEKYWNEIPKVIAFSKKVNLNYDCLRAIAFELSNGLSFEVAILDLNIINNNAEHYLVTCYFTDGTRLSTRREIELDLFNSEDTCVYLYDSNGNNPLDVYFNPNDNYYDINRRAMVIKGSDVRPQWLYDQEDIDSWNEKKRAANEDYLSYYGKEIECLVLKRKMEKNIHYMV